LLSLSSFRNAWQLNRKTQAALRYLIEWYNGLDANARARAPDAKTLMSIASRLPRTPKDLVRIKGVPHSWANRHGATLTRDLGQAVERAREDDFVPIDPPPYTTFEEIRTEAWLGVARAEVCFRRAMAPDLVLPGRVHKQLLAELLDERDLHKALQSLSGWRRDLLVDEMLEFAKQNPPPFLIHPSP
jgi:ribonuclease D